MAWDLTQEGQHQNVDTGSGSAVCREVVVLDGATTILTPVHNVLPHGRDDAGQGDKACKYGQHGDTNDGSVQRKVYTKNRRHFCGATRAIPDENPRARHLLHI